ncbi:hypothetical protein [Kibdelosporangium aridum]|uniref:hypothetical protein n=1 Tax=Kibdelosporangium aridum TaxID=2030 RepID=UPI000527AA4B
MEPGNDPERNEVAAGINNNHGDEREGTDAALRQIEYLARDRKHWTCCPATGFNVTANPDGRNLYAAARRSTPTCPRRDMSGTRLRVNAW